MPNLLQLKYEIFGLNLEIKSLKECIEKINAKLLPDRNYNQELNTKNSFFRTTKFSLKQEIPSKQNIIDILLDV